MFLIHSKMDPESVVLDAAKNEKELKESLKDFPNGFVYEWIDDGKGNLSNPQLKMEYFALYEVNKKPIKPPTMTGEK